VDRHGSDAIHEKWRAVLAHRLAQNDVCGLSNTERELMQHYPLFQLVQLGKLAPFALEVCRPMLEPIPILDEERRLA